MSKAIKEIPVNPHKKYQVVLWHNDSTTSLLTHRNRTAWCVEVAKKHKIDVIRRKLAGEFPTVQTCTLVLE